MKTPDQVTWHSDGHSLFLTLTQADVSISMVRCPNEGKSGPCFHPKVGCVVTWFLMNYGLECHVGVSYPEEEMVVAWALIGESYDIDACQVWVISVNDLLFSTWAASQVQESSPVPDLEE
jgi:hypothetical protein